MLLDERLEAGGARPASEAGDGDRFVALGQIDDHGRHAGKVDLIAVHHAERDARRDPGVHRVSTRLQDGVAGFGGEVMAG